MTRRTKIILGITASLLIVLGVVGYLLLNKKNTLDSKDDTTQVSSAEYKKINTTIEATGTTDEELEKLVSEYGPQYEAALASLRKVSPDKWTATQVDQAHLCLLYADKTSAYSQAQDIYYQISSAQQTGVKVDENSAGVTQAKRDEIKARADAAQSSMPKSGELPQ